VIEVPDGRSAPLSLGIDWALIALWTALGYFVYHGLAGMLAVLALSILYSLATLLALIPFAGVVLQGLVMHFLITPWVFELTGIEATWLTALVFWVDIALGCFLTFTMSLAAIEAIRG
jgi:hypothetical protein